MTKTDLTGYTPHHEDKLGRDLDMVLDRVQHLLDTEDQHSSYFDENPWPSWLKWVSKGAMLMGRVNAAYTRATGITVRAYAGETDQAVWGDEVAFNEYDREVIQKRVKIPIAEHAKNPMTGELQVWVGWKWPYIVRGQVVGVWGKAVPVPKALYDNYEELIEFIIYQA